MNPNGNPIEPPPQWYNPQQMIFQPQSIPYCPPYPLYSGYNRYNLFPQESSAVPIQCNSQLFWQTPSGPIMQMAPVINPPSQLPRESNPVRPPNTEIANDKLPTLPISLAISTDKNPQKTDNKINEPEKISRKKEHGVYRCHKCDRTYLSYPALYTHNKLKHPSNSEPVDKKPTNRGRPKKNVFIKLRIRTKREKNHLISKNYLIKMIVEEDLVIL